MEPLHSGSTEHQGETNPSKGSSTPTLRALEGKEEEEAEETKLIWKLDRRLIPWLGLLYALCYLDRSNISNVKDALMESLDLDEEQFALAISTFYIGYIALEIPSNLMLKKANPAYWIGSLVIAWGLCAASVGSVKSLAGLLAARFFLGITESGFLPGLIFYLSKWYPPVEQSFRMALLFAANGLGAVASGILASLFLQFDEFLGLENWRWLFIFEGLLTVLCGFLTFPIIPSSPEKLKTLNQQEIQMVHERMIQAQTPFADKTINYEDVWSTLISLEVWGFAILFVCITTPTFAKTFFGPAIVNTMGYSTVQSNLMVALVALVGVCLVLFNGYHAAKTKERANHVIIPVFIGLMGFILLTVATYVDVSWASYLCMFPAGVQGCCLPVIISWLNSTIKGSTQVATASALVVSVGNFGGIIGNSIYGVLYEEPNEGEENGTYIKAHGCMIFFLLVAFIVALLLKKYAPPESHQVEETLMSVSNPSLSESSPLLNEKKVNL